MAGLLGNPSSQAEASKLGHKKTTTEAISDFLMREDIDQVAQKPQQEKPIQPSNEANFHQLAPEKNEDLLLNG